MRAWIARMTEDNIDQSAIEKAGEILKNGGLAAFPTETVYGLGGNALDAKASEKIYAAKGRPSDNPLIVHIGRMEDLETVAANVPESARKLAAACWPGPLTMIFEKTNAVPLETTGGLTSVAAEASVDGRQYAIPAVEVETGSVQVLNVRQDWLDEYGLDAPKTLDDVENIAKVFAEKKPAKPQGFRHPPVSAADTPPPPGFPKTRPQSCFHPQKGG